MCVRCHRRKLSKNTATECTRKFHFVVKAFSRLVVLTPYCSHMCNKSRIRQVHGTQFVLTLILPCITWLCRCRVININLYACRRTYCQMPLYHTLTHTLSEFGLDCECVCVQLVFGNVCEMVRKAAPARAFFPNASRLCVDMVRPGKICLTGTVFFNVRFWVR